MFTGNLLTAEEIDARAAGVPEWIVNEEGTEISRTLKFESFAQSMSFSNAVAKVAEDHNHHPGINIVYKKVILTLTTFSHGGLTENDFMLAEKIDRLPMPSGETMKDEPFLAG